MLTHLFDQLAIYVLSSASMVLLLLMGWKFRKVAATGSVRKMLISTFAVPAMVLGAVLGAVFVARIARPLLDQNLMGQPVVGGLSAARTFASALDAGIAWAQTPYQGGAPASDGQGDYMGQVYAQVVAGGGSLASTGGTDATTNAVAYVTGWGGDTERLSNPAPAQPVVVQPVRSTANAGAARSHKVLPGESLSSIANFYYGNKKMWRAICDANRSLITDCSSISVGWTLTLPAVGEQEFTQLASTAGDGGNETATQNGPLAADGRVYYETSQTKRVPAQLAVTCQGCDPVKAYVEAANSSPVAPAPVIQSATVNHNSVIYAVPTKVFEISVSGGTGVTVQAQPTPLPQPTAPPVVVAAVQLDLAAPRVDTGVADFSITGTNSGMTITTGQ